MNNDLISRRALLEKATGVVKCDEGGWDCNVRAVFVDDVLNAPAVDPEEVFKSLPYVKEALEMAKQKVAPLRHGRWIPCSDKHAFSEECSVCGEAVLWDDGRLHHYNYCPHCGAKMEICTALSEAEPLAGCVDDADLEHMTRFAMQQAVNRK